MQNPSGSIFIESIQRSAFFLILIFNRCWTMGFNASWTSPCLLVPKLENIPRFCTDFRNINSVTKPDSFPLPRMGECVVRVARFVSKLDLLKIYWQVPLSARAHKMSAFITSSGLLLGTGWADVVLVYVLLFLP